MKNEPDPFSSCVGGLAFLGLGGWTLVLAGLGIGLLLGGVHTYANSYARVADGQSTGAALLGGAADAFGVGGIYAGFTNQDIGTGQNLHLTPEDRAAMIGGGLGGFAGAAAGGVGGARFGVALRTSTLRPGGMGNIGSHAPVNPTTALSGAERWLGPGYREIAPGVYRSADGLRQFRMTNSDLLPTHGNIGPHVHFEIPNPAGGPPLENLHLSITP